MNITDSPTFCPRPWTTLDLRQDSKVRVCPHNLEPIGNTNNETMDSIVNNSTILKSMKETIANGQWATNCSHCRELENIGKNSERQEQIRNCSMELKSEINKDINTFMLTETMIAWSNLCNLSCNYCDGWSSTTWQLTLNKSFNLISVSDDAKDWVINNSNNLKSVMLYGGEPLLQKKLPELLSALKSKSNIAIITNLSAPLETNPVFNAIITNKDINPVKWFISFDNVGERFEYVRHGSNWDLFKNNIDILKKYNQIIIAHSVYGLYSALTLEEYFDFCVGNDLNVFYGKMQYFPIEQDIRYAPQSIIELAVQNIDKILIKYKDKLNLNELIDYRNTLLEDTSYRELSNKDKATKILASNQNIENILPKKKTFAELWPNVQQLLEEEIN